MSNLSRLAICLLVPAGLGAADFTGGIQLGAAFPQGDMKALTDGNTGAQLVLFGLWNLGDGQAIRGRLDGIAASGNPSSIPHPAGRLQLDGKVDISAGIGTLGADYLYFFNGKVQEGPYAGAGLAYGNNKLTVEVGKTSADEEASSLVLGLYGGYHFTRHWSMELGFRSSRFKKSTNLYNFNYSMPVLTLSAGYTF